jgi:hypothetical protein
MSGQVAAEGWYRDPYGVHEDRWFSDGRPTKLVRDGGVEASDEPPSEPHGELVAIPAPELTSPDDLRRADDAEACSGLDEAAMRERASSTITTTWPTW